MHTCLATFIAGRKNEASSQGRVDSNCVAVKHFSEGEKIRGPELRKYILISAKDGYQAILALAEADPMIQPNQILVADKLDGKPLDDKNGPLKLVVPQDQRPARWVRMVTKISVRQAP